MKNETIFLSASDKISELNASKYITKVLTKGRALKVMSCFEKLREQINSFCVTYIGISAFSKENFQADTLQPLIDGYKKTMSNLDPSWWKTELSNYIDEVRGSIPPGVIFLLTECNNSDMIELCIENDYLLLRAEGVTNKNDSQFLSKESFSILSTNSRCQTFPIDNDFDHNKEEDINESQLNFISKILQA